MARTRAIGPHTPAGTAAAVTLGERAAPLFSLERAASGGEDMDAVHDMRVASRRTRAALAVFGDLYPARRLRRWRRRIRRVTRALGLVRDSDVFLAEFASLASRAGSEPERVAVAWIAGRRQAERAQQLAAMREQLASLDLGRRRAAFAAFAGAPVAGAASSEPLSALAARAIGERLGALLAAAPAALDEPASAGQHAMRIAAKKLRYAIETLRPALGEPADAPLGTLKRLQDALGELHDRDVFLASVRELSGSPEAAAAGVTAEGLAGVESRLAAERAERFAAFRALWEAEGERLAAALEEPLS